MNNKHIVGASVALGLIAFGMGLLPKKTVTNTPLLGAEVTFNGRKVVTDANGNFVIDGIPAGESGAVRVSKPGFSFSPPEIPVAAINSNLDGTNFSATAVTASDASFTLRDAVTAVKKDVVIPLEFNGVGVTIAAFDLVYDPLLVSFKSVAVKNLPSGVVATTSNISANRVRVLIQGVSNVVWSPGAIADLTFTAVGPGTAKITMKRPNTDVDGAQVSGSDGKTLDAIGNSATVTISLRGDLNHNNKLDVADIQALINSFLGVSPIDLVQEDFNNNSQVDVGDIALIISAYLGDSDLSVNSEHLTKKQSKFVFKPNGTKISVLSIDFANTISVKSDVVRADLKAIQVSKNGMLRYLVYSNNGKPIPKMTLTAKTFNTTRVTSISGSSPDAVLVKMKLTGNTVSPR